VGSLNAGYEEPCQHGHAKARKKLRQTGRRSPLGPCNPSTITSNEHDQRLEFKQSQPSVQALKTVRHGSSLFQQEEGDSSPSVRFRRPQACTRGNQFNRTSPLVSKKG